MADARHELGRDGEREAERFLRRLGLRTLARRFSTPAGELDLVMQQGRTIVFVEVKTQSDDRFLDPHERVDSRKQGRLLRAAKWYILRNRLEERPLRFDVVAILAAPDAPPQIRHFPDAFAPQHW